VSKPYPSSGIGGDRSGIGSAADVRLSLAGVVAGIAAIVVVASVGTSAVHVASDGLTGLDVCLACGTAITIGEILRVWLPGGRETAPLGTAASVAFALLAPEEPGVPGLASLPRASTVIAVIAVAMLLGLAPHQLIGRAPALGAVTRRFLAAAALVALWRTVPVAGRGSLAELSATWRGSRWVVAALMMLVVAVVLVLDAVLAGLIRAADQWARVRTVLRDELRIAAGLSGAIGASGVLIALANQPMGLLAVPMFLSPLVITLFAFRRYTMVRATYGQTIRSLSRVTELAGYTEAGHSRRVAALALAVGRDLGLTERELRDLEYAALLHDIGQLALAEPIPGGATLMAAPMEQRRIADLGADVVRRTGVLDDVATIIERQSEPYRRQYQTDDLAVPLASRIIRTANAYDDLVGDEATGTRRREALERIHLGLAYEYDPRVVAALTRVVTRGG
jgi:hypothetical protein